MTDTTPDVDFSFVRYANCWEDATILVKALQPSCGKRILSIASAGDNALSLLCEGAEVIACDLNVSQVACTELRQAAIRACNRDAFLGFCGVNDSADRLAVYKSIRPELSELSRKYWDNQRDCLESGFIHHGKFERYFHMFRKRVLPLVHRRSTVMDLLKSRSADGRREFYDSRWNNLRWRAMFKIFFSRTLMGRLGRDPAFFKHVEGSVASRILERTEYAFTELDTSQNPYLTYILTGNYGPALPLYMREGNYERVRANIDNLTVVQGAVDAVAEQYQSAGFDGFNLSDIFEYLTPEQCSVLYDKLLHYSNAGARFAYWNMLVPRSCPTELLSRIELLDNEASCLFAQDQAFFYSRFVLERVR